MSAVNAFGLLLAAVGGASGALALRSWLGERRYLRAFLEGVVPGGRIRTREDLVALRRAVRGRVRFDPTRAADPRPLLRDTARRVLEDGWGFCGENARASVLLLLEGGVRAHRLYLFGARWGHVVAEHRWEGGWRLFDAHDDARTCPPDEALGRIDAGDVASFPNAAVENPWRGAAWARWARAAGLLSRWHPPRAVVRVVESPDLIRSLAGALLLAAGLAIALA